jgi:hypothetical protein
VLKGAALPALAASAATSVAADGKADVVGVPTVVRLTAELADDTLAQTSVGQPWTRRLLRDVPIDASIAVEPELPEWLAGTWNVSAKFAGVKLPLGRTGISINTPGVRMASVALLPNVGGEPRGYAQRYTRTQDVAFNVQRDLEAYWLGSNATASAVGERGSVRVAVTPPSGGDAPPQRIDLTPVHAVWASPSADDFIFEQVWKQKNIDGAFEGQFKVLQRFRRNADGSVISRQKIVGFAHPTDPGYMETEGKATVTYEMDYVMVPLP